MLLVGWLRRVIGRLRVVLGEIGARGRGVGGPEENTTWLGPTRAEDRGEVSRLVVVFGGVCSPRQHHRRSYARSSPIESGISSSRDADAHFVILHYISSGIWNR